MSSNEERPHLEVRDPKAMRALAHPLRMQLIEVIGQSDTGTLTATYGFVEEAGGGRGRERPWRLRFRGLELAPPWQDEESRLAAGAATSIWIGRWMERAQERLMSVLSYPPEWQEAAFASHSAVYLTAREATELSEAMRRLLEPYTARWHDAALRPSGSLPHEVLVFGYPLTDPPPSPEPT